MGERTDALGKAEAVIWRATDYPKLRDELLGLVAQVAAERFNDGLEEAAKIVDGHRKDAEGFNVPRREYQHNPNDDPYLQKLRVKANTLKIAAAAIRARKV